MRKCEICGRTEEECRIRNIKGHIFCPKHLTQWYRYGEFKNYTIYEPNEYIIENDCAKIILKNKQGEFTGCAIIDKEDVDKCKQYKWHIKKSLNTNYAMAHLTGKKKIFLHRFVLGYEGGEDIDHINHNGLDNRKNNLRIVSHKKNLSNQNKELKRYKKNA